MVNFRSKRIRSTINDIKIETILIRNLEGKIINVFNHADSNMSKIPTILNKHLKNSAIPEILTQDDRTWPGHSARSKSTEFFVLITNL